jgi:hypothetical protein
MCLSEMNEGVSENGSVGSVSRPGDKGSVHSKLDIYCFLCC